MALADLAAAADLSTRGVDVSDTARVAAALAAASAAVRDAAGCPISSVTATITLPAPAPGEPWLDLPGPVTDLASVEVAGVAVTDYVRQGSRLWRSCGWRGSWEPVNVDVTLTFGYAEVPADIVSLVCDLAQMSLAQDAPVASSVVQQSESIDDYTLSQTFAQGSEAAASVLEVPPRTRAWLRARFGSAVVVTRERT